MLIMKHIHRRHILLLALFVSIIVFKIVACLGVFYTHNIYPLIANILSHITSSVPLPLGDIFITSSICWVVAYPIYQIAYKQRQWKHIVLHVVEYLAWVYVWFYAAWGLNYSQPNIYERMNIQPVEASAQTFRKFAYQYADSLNATYERNVQEQKCDGESCKIATGNINKTFKERVHKVVLNGYSDIDSHGMAMGINHPFNHCDPAKTMLFSHLSTMVGVTGSMAPFLSEFTLNADLQPHEYATTYAHEYAHFLGIANEGEANFYSYVVCTASKDNAVRFSGYYHIFFHMLANVKTLLGEGEYEAYVSRIHPDIIRLAHHDSDYWLSRRNRMLDSAQNVVYNLYLRGNRVEGGTKSYSGVIGIIMAWEFAQNMKKKSTGKKERTQCHRMGLALLDYYSFLGNNSFTYIR